MKHNVCLSIVSHGHREHLVSLMGDLVSQCPDFSEIRVLANIPEDLSGLKCSKKPRFSISENSAPMGFGANHNKNLAGSTAEFYLILNPDIRLDSNPLPELLGMFDADPTVALVAPRVTRSNGELEDSIRYFPTLIDLFKKAVGLGKGQVRLSSAEPACVPWVAGMFMLIRSDVFNSLGGFDEGFYLYYEDVDLCARIHQAGYKVRVAGSATVIHDAQRDSRRKLKFMVWHAKSMLRFFFKYGLTGRLNAKL